MNNRKITDKNNSLENDTRKHINQREINKIMLTLTNSASSKIEYTSNKYNIFVLNSKIAVNIWCSIPTHFEVIQDLPSNCLNSYIRYYISYLV